MNELETEFEWKFENYDIREVWLYVNPLTGRYARLREGIEPLAVFSNENIGRAYETKSDILRNMIGHYVNWEEMLSIAKEKTNGNYELILEVS